jgi:hypothetical protein
MQLNITNSVKKLLLITCSITAPESQEKKVLAVGQGIGQTGRSREAVRPRIRVRCKSASGLLKWLPRNLEVRKAICAN